MTGRLDSKTSKTICIALATVSNTEILVGAPDTHYVQSNTCQQASCGAFAEARLFEQLRFFLFSDEVCEQAMMLTTASLRFVRVCYLDKFFHHPCDVPVGCCESDLHRGKMDFESDSYSSASASASEGDDYDLAAVDRALAHLDLLPGAAPAGLSASSQAASMQPLKNRLLKVDARMNSKDKADRATSEQVLDPRTRLILYKLINTRVVSAINGCISTGKEANVYHAVRSEKGSADVRELAIKVYKTSILVFKDRDQYVSGEFRFRNGYNRKNPRKMVKLWAEKEMRNLKRLHTAGMLCPEPILLRQHVLVMSFMGVDGVPIPRLKDVDFISPTSSKWGDIYVQVIAGMYRMFHECRLVHADLSEYNLLLTPALEVVWIDVSQSVEMDHPRAIDFLRMDVRNVSSFFRRHEVRTLKLRVLFDLITKRHPMPAGSTEAVDGFYSALEEVQNDENNFAGFGTDDDNTVEQNVFEQTHIPRHVMDVVNFENDQSQQLHMYQQYADAVASSASFVPRSKDRDVASDDEDSDKGDVSAQKSSKRTDRIVTKRKAAHRISREHRSEAEIRMDQDEDCSEEMGSQDSDESMSNSRCSGDDSEQLGVDNGNPTYDGELSKVSPEEEKRKKKEHKKSVKEANRERRKEKMPKHVKRRAEKVAKAKTGK
jgi:RIO kinase 1